MDLAPAPPAPMGWGFWAIMADRRADPPYHLRTGSGHNPPGYCQPDRDQLDADLLCIYRRNNGPGNDWTEDEPFIWSLERGYPAWIHRLQSVLYVYSLNKTAFSLSNETLTPTPFDDPGMIQAESSYMDDLKNTTSVRFRGGRLTFYDVGGKPVLVFEQSVS